MGLYDLSFYEVICRNSQTFSENICWHEVDDNRRVTFQDYKNQVDSLAGGLAKAGITKGDRIGIIGKNSFEFFLIYGAAAFLGAVVLPINWRLSGDEMIFNLNDCSPRLVFSDEEFQETLIAQKDELTTVTRFFNLKENAGTWDKFTSLMDVPPQQPEDVSSDDGFVIIHTAAVAGRPRGALLSHANLLLSNTQFAYYMEISQQDVHLNLLPLFHVGGLFLAASTFHAGGMNLNVSKFDAAQAAKLIEQHTVSLFFDFPPILDSILQAAEAGMHQIYTLRAVVGLGTPETIEKFQAVTGGSYFVMYGQTETACLVSIGRYSEMPGSAGRPILLTDVLLTDEYDNPVPTGEPGEITVKGPMVFKGYWELDEDNAYTFREGRHHTGDMGRFDAQGYLFYAGRKAEKELIKPGGENVYPAEVEKVVLQHPAVKQTVVIGVPDPKWKEGIKAVCVLEKGQKLEAPELIEFVGQRIARFKKPQYVEFVESLPLDDNETVDRQEVKRLYG